MLTLDPPMQSLHPSPTRTGRPTWLNINTIPAWLSYRAKETPTHSAYSQRLPDGRWKSTSWREVSERVSNLAVHLAHLGLEAGDRAVIMMPASQEWDYCQMALLSLGAVVVGLDAHDSAENQLHILRIVAPRALFAVNQAQLDRLCAACEQAPEFAIPLEASSPDRPALQDLLATTAKPLRAWPAVKSEQVATIIFSSGSTGRPKGIAYTHQQICLAGQAILSHYPGIDHGARLACWLPLSNLFQRIINLCAMMCGAHSYFVDSPSDIIRLLPEIRPTLFIGVPRFYEKLYSRIQADIARRPLFIRGLVGLAWRIGERYHALRRQSAPISLAMALAYRAADRLVLARLRAIMGPGIRFMVSGSAPLPPWLLEKLHGLGWLVLEAYGTSECVVPIAANTPSAYRIGSVGQPLPENELRLAEDGEVLIRGEGVFKGYVGVTEDASRLDEEGYLHTGDLGRLDASGYLWLTGRKSDIFKTSTGHRVAPVPVEYRLKQLPFVEDAVLLGRNRPAPVALLCLDLSAGPDIATNRPLPRAFLDEIERRVAQACVSLAPSQRPVGALVTRRGLSIAEGELTSNLKLRRDVIEARFHTSLDTLYAVIQRASEHNRITIMESP